jgi:plastocyanin
LIAALLILSSTPGNAATIQIKIKNLIFVPAQVSAHIGDTIQWVNTDFVVHTATARDGSWDVMLSPNVTRSIHLKNAVTIDYYCKFHPNMTGQITVSK